MIKDTELIHVCLESGIGSDATDFTAIVMNETTMKLHDYYGCKRKREVEIKERVACSIKKSSKKRVNKENSSIAGGSTVQIQSTIDKYF